MKTNKRRSVNSMAGNPITFIAIPVILLLITSVIIVTYNTTQQTSNVPAIKKIKEFMRRDGSINDYMGEIGVKDENDIKWFQDKDKIKIEFGKIALTYSTDTFESKEMQEQLSYIGITVRKNKKTGEYILYWHDKKLEKWVS